VAGIVRSATTGGPLRSAVVTLRSIEADQKLSSTATGADGSFRFSGLQPGQYQLTVRKSGFQSFQGDAAVTILRESTETTSLAPSLWPNGAIGGRVVDWEGEPVPEAEVYAYAVTYQTAQAALSLAARGESDDVGEYRLFDLPAGKYILQVSPPRTDTPSGKFYAGTPAVYYPGAPAPAQAVPIELNWGEESARADVRLAASRSHAVAGVVWDALSDGPCARCVVNVMQHDGLYRVSLPQTARVSPDGRFVLRGLSSGDYTLVVRQGSSKGAVAQTEASLRDRRIDELRLSVGLRQAVTGQFALENPPDGIGAGDWIPRLTPVALPAWWPRAEGKVRADRQFAIENVAPARYRFEVSGLPPGAYLKALRAGGHSLPAPEIVVPSEAGISGLQAVISFDGATVRGKVQPPGSTGNASLVQARLFLLPQQGESSFQLAAIKEAATDGSFSIASLAPGRYTLYALPPTTSVQIFDPAVQAALARYAVQLNLGPSEIVNVDAPLVTQPR
jgi:hypothetical protein